MAQEMDKAEQAFQQLRQMLITLEITPGDLLDERQLCSTLGVGRTPVREALQRLSYNGLVVVVPRRGTFASPIGVRDVWEVYESRIGIEGYAARLVAEKTTEETIVRWDELLLEVKATVATQDVVAISRMDDQLHQELWALTRNTHIQAAAERCFLLSRRIWYYTYQHGLQSREHFRNPEDWALIIDTFRERDPVAAQRAMEQHVAHVSRIVMDSNWFRSESNHGPVAVRREASLVTGKMPHGAS